MAEDDARQNQTLAIATHCEQLRLPHVVCDDGVVIRGGAIISPAKHNTPGGWIYCVFYEGIPIRDWYNKEGAVQCAVVCCDAVDGNNVQQ